MKSASFVERLHFAQRVKVEAEAKAAARAAEPVAEVIEQAPIHSCGIRQSRCADCRAWVCRAPGHARHVCTAAEFVQEGA